MDKKNEGKTYTKSYYCNNCENHFVAVFKFGEVATKPVCPICGVSHKKSWIEEKMYSVLK